MDADLGLTYCDGVLLGIRDRFEAVAVVEWIPPRRRLDWVVAALLALTAVPVALDDSLPWWARVVPAGVGIGFIPFRRQIPLTAVTSVSVATGVCVAFAFRGAGVVDVAAPAGLADVVLFYALCRWSTPLRVGIGFIISVCSEVIVEWSVGGLQVQDWILVLPWFVLAAFALAMRYRALAIASRLDQARLAERNSLARELHDTVAHHVSAIAVQAQAGQYVAESDPGASVEVLRSIEALANESIDEMRRMVGILRSEGNPSRTVAPDSLDALAVKDGRPAVHVRGDTQLRALPAGIRTALFRIAQESITNARQHSRDVTFVDIAVEYHGDRVQMTVENDGTPTTRNAGSGFGQIGMQERVELLGGTFESSARAAHGWRTRTSIPLARIRR